jgi:hypothetical protein
LDVIADEPGRGDPRIYVLRVRVNMGSDIPEMAVVQLFHAPQGLLEDPGSHKFSCGYPEGHTGPILLLSIGPNYIFEFFRAIWQLRGAILGALAILFGSFMLSFGIATLHRNTM